jgi:hypothetical protein
MFNFAMHCLLSSKQSAGEQATTDELHELAFTAGIEPATSAVRAALYRLRSIVVYATGEFC